MYICIYIYKHTNKDRASRLNEPASHACPNCSFVIEETTVEQSRQFK